MTPVVSQGSVSRNRPHMRQVSEAFWQVRFPTSSCLKSLSQE
jgi:hypothetical protein